MDEVAVRESSNNWVWKHLLKLDDSTVQCNIDNCNKTYTTFDRNKGRLTMMIKGHLYHEHEKYDEEDRLKWENDNDLIWRYFDKVDLYKEKCKFCNNSLCATYISKLRSHLQRHYQTIRAMVRKEIANMSLSQYFKINEDKFSATCKRCNYNTDILYGTDKLIHHIQKDQCLRYRKRYQKFPN